MVNLFLSEPLLNDVAQNSSSSSNIDVILPLLNKLGSQIQSLVTRGGRSEARLWLCSALSSVNISSRKQLSIFMKLLRSKPRMIQFVSQLLTMMFEKRPRKLGSLLAKRSYILERFFEGNPKRILEWFSDFAYDGGSDHKRGAKALAQFAFANRDTCWEELEWRGKHGQSPAVVATKPHYFLDLDVERTIENFLDNVPEFWSSNEFAESLNDGQVLFLDTKFFRDLFIRFMYEEDMNDVWDAVEEFLTEESFSSLTQHLLITLEERDFCRFLELLGNYFAPRIESWDSCDSSCWLGVVLSYYVDTEPIDELLLVNSVINQGRQLLRLVRDENLNDEEELLRETTAEIFRGLENGSSFSLILRDLSKMKHVETIKLLGLLSWTIHFRLSEECQTPDSWELLFRENGIEFRRSSDHSLLSHKGFSEESESDSDSRSRVSKKRHKKEKKKRKKKKKKAFDDDDDDDDLGDDDELLGVHQISRSWLLSTDGFTATWTTVSGFTRTHRKVLLVDMDEVVTS
ncbi:uncharacterized protein LOC17875550 isoform X2 [Capsella rubella]|uniref:uncharacterized protein LOC17875550 isoform X2 n=1 Tax=Capsella rubella TaxID=81985 RepID=UPI000CD551AC|nr:uncharacterized protein LOC17875550 isoform X2 [Capsella rubella]